MAETTITLDSPAVPADGVAGWQDEHVEVLLEVTESMTSADGSRAALDRLAALALRATGADRCAILVRDPSGRKQLLPAAAASRTGDPEELWKLFRDMDPVEVGDEPERASIWGSTRVFTLDDARGTALIPERWRRVWKVRSLALAKLRAGGETYGVLAVAYESKRHRFTPEERRLLESIGIAAGVALRSARLVERLQRSIVVERRLAECTAALRSGRSLPEVLDLVARRFVALLPGTSCWINVLSPDGTTITRVATTVDRPGPAENRLDDLPREDVETIRQIWMRDPGYPIVIPDLAERRGWERFIPPEIGTGMLLPLSDGRAVHGFIALGRESEPFSADELAIAVAFADRVGFAFTQARLTDALQLRVNLTEALYRLSDAVVRTSDLKAALAALNRDVCAELGVECVRLTFRDAAFAKALRLPPPSRSELAMIKAWGGKGGNETSPEGNELAVPVPMNNRTTGILWVRSEEFDAGRIEFARAVAVGLGEVAQKAKLRRTAEERARQLAVAAERERLAHDLHDAVGQTFYGMGMKLQDLVREVEGGPLAARLESLRELAALGVADVRSAVDALSAMHLRALGFLPSIRALARQFTLATSVPAELRLAETNLSLPPEVESALYRTLHEALVNVHRHARATGVVISLRRGPKILELMVRDDGVGLDQRQVADWRSAAHFGMRRMAKSIEEVGGRFKATAAHPRGLLVHAVVPLKV